MKPTIERNNVTIYHVDQQATGAFDGGRITETKPIGFPGESGAVDRVGPLFYWAWASAKDEGTIALHPHRGFEIVSYVVSGKLGHYDTLGTRRAVSDGGIQVMQTGSGVSHEEAMLEPNTQFLQIWFEPDLQDAVQRPPTYADYEAGDLATQVNGGVETTPLLGEAAAMQLVTDANARVVRLNPGATYTRPTRSGRSIAALVIKGEGQIEAAGTITPRDFIIMHAEDDASFSIDADSNHGLELVEIDVPTRVDYPLYKSR